MIPNLSTGFKIITKRSLKRLITSPQKRVFCISMQRNGTTSVGDFLSDHGYRVARWVDSNYYNWSYQVSTGNIESIFNSRPFNAYNAFEDSPWYHPGVYKKLYQRFPESRFILLHRDSEDWFNSMLRHSGGKTPGNTFRHCQIYRRLPEFYKRLEEDPDFLPTLNETDNLMSLEGKKDHYISVYEEYNKNVITFFDEHNSQRLFVGRLEDPDKWQKMGQFLNLDVSANYQVHSNKS